MLYNFDSQIERSHTNCIKYDFREQVFGDSDILPMWIADMDIAIPDFIIDAVKKRAEHPVYGYSFFSDSYYDNFIRWMYKRHGLHIEREWICFSPGVVPALNMAVLTYTRPKDKIIIQPPVYPPFFNEIICCLAFYFILRSGAVAKQPFIQFRPSEIDFLPVGLVMRYSPGTG